MRKSPSRIFACAILALNLNCIFVHAQSQAAFDQESLKERGALSEAQEAVVEKRRESITSEAEATANEWVGTYSLDDSLTSGARFDWAPANGFLVRWNTCSHGWKDRINFGRVDFRDGVLHLIADLVGEGGKVYDLGPDMVAVKWGEQHYLVPSNRLIAFCYAARNAGRSSEIDEFFLKEADREKRRFGLPQVPSDYKKYLFAKPIQAKIIGVKPRQQAWVNEFTLNVGRMAGVVPGMKFFAISPGNVYMLVEVIEVRDTNSEAYAITSGFKNHSDKEVRPKVGWRLTSRAPKGAYEYFPG
jgi:hypothetical protein